MCFCFFSEFVFHFPSQNEPTFYTEDGTPFTAADPGEDMSRSARSTNISTKKKNKVIFVGPFEQIMQLKIYNKEF